MLMQIWLVSPNVWESAKCLDSIRLKRTYNTIRYVCAMRHAAGSQQPVCNIWGEYYRFLIWYAAAIRSEWVVTRKLSLQELCCDNMWGLNWSRPSENQKPWWIRDERYLNAQRSSLLSLDYFYYCRFGWDLHIELNFWWPYINSDTTFDNYKPFYQVRKT